MCRRTSSPHSCRANRRSRARRTRGPSRPAGTALRVRRGGRGAAGARQAGARFGLTLNADPYSITAENLVPRLRAAAQAASPTARVGGPTAQQKHFNTAAGHDNRLIVPIVLLQVFVIRALLLRAVHAAAAADRDRDPVLGRRPRHLLGGVRPPVRLSGRALDAAATGLHIPRSAVEYNIFLMARAREEATGEAKPTPCRAPTSATPNGRPRWQPATPLDGPN